MHALITTLMLSVPVVGDASQWQWRLAFAPDMQSAYFAVSDGWFPRTRVAGIVRVERIPGGGWTPAVAVSFSGPYSDMDPHVTPDGQRLYFSSSRPADGEPRSVFDLWYVERVGDGWGEPVRLGDEVNSDQDELYASTDASGVLYFASGPPAPGGDAAWNIYRARPDGEGGFHPREPLTAVNSDAVATAENPVANWDFNPEVSSDGRRLFFTSLRDGGEGLGDLYFSIRCGDDWSPPRNVGPAINSRDDEYHPTLSPDGRTLYFVRARFRPEVVPGRFHAIAVDELSDVEIGPPCRMSAGPDRPD